MADDHENADQETLRELALINGHEVILEFRIPKRGPGETLPHPLFPGRTITKFETPMQLSQE